jgi:hypothetical protein
MRTQIMTIILLVLSATVFAQPKIEPTTGSMQCLNTTDVFVVPDQQSASTACGGGSQLHYTAMDFDVTKVPFVTESSVIETALKHYSLMDKMNKDSLTSVDMLPHMQVSEIKIADPENKSNISRGGYIVETVKRFNAADTNCDGKITPDEWATSAGQNLLRMLRMPN